MKIESLNTREMLTAHLSANYKDTEVLVLFDVRHLGGDTNDETNFAIAEWNRLIAELDGVGYKFPSIMSIDDFIIIQMDIRMANNFINKHEKGMFRMEAWRGGTCINENR